MEINLKKLGEQAIESTTSTKKMRLSEDAQSMVFQLFTKNVYSNPIGTVVREITSNCFDSHVEAGVKDMPVVIRKSFDDETETHYISFIDYGVGMSPDRVDNIYSVYFESTKRVDNTQIGGFGIGGKTPLAYKRSTGMGEGEYDNSFYVITVFEGVKYVYMVYEGAESPEVTLLHQEATNEGNGTEIRIPVLAVDVRTFEREMLKQLYYFENIVFEGFESEFVTNEYQIVRGKSFLFRGDKYDSKMHVCLGRVAYPIDYAALGFHSGDFAVPIAIKLEVGDINVTVSRESLDYSEKTIKLLKDKLEQAKAELIQMVGKQYSNITTLEDYFMAKHKFGYLKMSNGENIHVANMVSIKDVDFSNFKYNHLKMPNDKQLFSLFFSSKLYGKKPPKSSWRRTDEQRFDAGYEAITEKNNVYYIDRDLERKIIKQRYLSTIHSTYFIVRHANMFDWEKKEQLMSLFNLKIGTQLFDDKGMPVGAMLDILNMREDYFEIIQKYCEDYHTLEVPEDFKIARKQSATADILKREISVKIIGSWGKSKVKVKDLVDFNNIIFYGTQEDETKLDNDLRIYKTLFDNGVVSSYSEYYNRFEFDSDRNKKSGIMFVMVAKNNIKYFEYCKQAYSINDFYWKMLHRKKDMIMSYFNNGDVLEKYDALNKLYINPKFGLVSEDWGKHIEELNAEIVKFKKNVNTGIGNLKYYLQSYFDLTNVQPTDYGKKLLKMIDDLHTLDEINHKTMRFIDVDWNGNYLDTQPELVEILKKVMVL